MPSAAPAGWHERPLCSSYSVSGPSHACHSSPGAGTLLTHLVNALATQAPGGRGSQAAKRQSQSQAHLHAESQPPPPSARALEQGSLALPRAAAPSGGGAGPPGRSTARDQESLPCEPHRLVSLLGVPPGPGPHHAISHRLPFHPMLCTAEQLPSFQGHFPAAPAAGVDSDCVATTGV